MIGPRGESCSTCRWWTGPAYSHDQGCCRAHPPTWVDEDDMVEWPWVTYEDWCGEYAPRDGGHAEKESEEGGSVDLESQENRSTISMIEALRAHFDARMDQVEARVEAIEATLRTLDTRLAQAESVARLRGVAR